MLLTYSNVKLNEKPKGKDAAIVRSSLKYCKDINFEELKHICLNYTFIPSEINITGNPPVNTDWKSQSVFVIDIDNGKCPFEFIEYTKSIQLEPNIIYSSMSDSLELRKWRAIWILDEVVYDYDYALFLRTNLTSIFNGDKACKDASRMFYPGKEILFLNEEVMDLNYFKSVVESYYVTLHKGNITKLENISKSGKNVMSYIINIGHDGNSTNQIETIRTYDWKEACSKIKIMNEFFYTKNKLTYNEILGLATNLQYIRGGLQLMKKRMEQINNLGGGFCRETGKLFNYEAQHFGCLKIVKYGYSPMMLKNFSPFEEDCDYHNCLDLRPFARGRVDIIEEQNKISLDMAEKQLEKEFERVIDKVSNGDLFDLEPKIYIFKVATGIGKTRLLENIEGALLAFPTNSLKYEVYDRMKISNKEITPNYPIFSCEDLNNKLENLHSCGLYENASQIISSISKNKYNKHDVLEIDVEMAKNYIEQNEICRITTDTVLTTHKRAVTDNRFNTKYTIFDECPLNSIIEIGEATLNFSDFDNTEFKSDIQAIENFYRNIVGEDYIDNNRTFILKQKFLEYCAENGRVDLIGLLNSKYIFKDKHNKGKINFCSISKMKLEKNIIIMSATSPVEIWKKLYPNQVEVIDIDNISLTGQIKQYTKHSFSSSSISNVKKGIGSIDKIKNVLDIVQNSPIITHLKHREVFKNNKSNFWFGNCAGGDELNGQDIAVIGTPHKPQFVYYFYAKMLGEDIKASDNVIGDEIIEHNGMKFKFQTYKNDFLRMIQLSLIESELIQAVGRNRTLRQNCTTYLFSNLPLKISTEFIQN